MKKPYDARNVVLYFNLKDIYEDQTKMQKEYFK